MTKESSQDTFTIIFDEASYEVDIDTIWDKWNLFIQFCDNPDQREYRVQVKVSKEISDQFVEAGRDSIFPKFNHDNISCFWKLSNEFQFAEMTRKIKDHLSKDSNAVDAIMLIITDNVNDNYIKFILLKRLDLIIENSPDIILSFDSSQITKIINNTGNKLIKIEKLKELLDQRIKKEKEKKVSNKINAEVDDIRMEIARMKAVHDKDIKSLKVIIEKQKTTINNLTDRVQKLEEIIGTLSNLHRTSIEPDGEVRETPLSPNNDCSRSQIIPSRYPRTCIFDIKFDLNGALFFLIKEQYSFFDKNIVFSCPSNDLYNIIKPNSNDVFFSEEYGDFWLQIHLKNSIPINGIKIKSGQSCFLTSFIIKIDGKEVCNVKKTNGLAGENREMIFHFNETTGNNIKLKQTEVNSNGHETIAIKSIELLSSDPFYSKGVFATFSEKYGKDSHHWPVVHLSAQCNDLSKIIFPDNIIDTNIIGINPWIQIEFTKGNFILNAIRMKQCNLKNSLRNYEIVGSNDEMKPIQEWESIQKHNKAKINLTKYICFDTVQTKPFKFFRIFKNDSYKSEIVLSHLDLFGTYQSQGIFEE